MMYENVYSLYNPAIKHSSAVSYLFRAPFFGAASGKKGHEKTSNNILPQAKGHQE
jgi:hypothetical protein